MNNADKNKNINVINNLNANYKQFTFNFTGKSKIFLIIACVVFLTGMISFFARGFNLDIDFVGGTIMQFNIGRDLEEADVTDIENLVKEVAGADITLSVVRSGNPLQEVVIKTKEDMDTEKRDAVYEKIAATCMSRGDYPSAYELYQTVLANKKAIPGVPHEQTEITRQKIRECELLMKNAPPVQSPAQDLDSEQE